MEVNGAQDGKHLRLREAVVEGDIPEGPGDHEGGADRKPGRNRELYEKNLISQIIRCK